MRHFQSAHFIRHIVFISSVARWPVKSLHGSHAHFLEKIALIYFLPVLLVEGSRFHFFQKIGLDVKFEILKVFGVEPLRGVLDSRYAFFIYRKHFGIIFADPVFYVVYYAGFCRASPLSNNSSLNRRIFLPYFHFWSSRILRLLPMPPTKLLKIPFYFPWSID